MNCLQRADDIVHGSRNTTYGDPKQNHETTAALFSEFMRRRYGTFPELTPEDVCWFNICQKMSREAHCKTDDGLTDIAGYSANIEIVRKGWSISEGKASEHVEIVDDRPTEVSEYVAALAESAKQSVHSTTQVDQGDDYETPCKCSKCGATGHSTKHCWRVPHSKFTAVSPPRRDVVLADEELEGK